jgi:4-hydroxy-tetrahydrodipicolinate synthase
LDAFEAGEVASARELHHGLLPVLRAFGRVGGVSFAKAALRLTGLDAGKPRLPLVAAEGGQLAAVEADLTEAGVMAGVPVAAAP